MLRYGFDKKETMIRLWCEENGKKKAEACLLPGSGCNLCGFSVDGVEYLLPPPLPGIDNRHFGTPVLYPFPGVVSERKMTFDGAEYLFPTNRGTVYRHGYVTDQKFEVSEPERCDDGICVRAWIEIKQNHPLFRIFPIENRLDLCFTLKADRLLIDIQISNLDAEKRFPFGFGLHPYLNLFGSGETVTVPMKKWMDLDTGNLLDPVYGPADLREPTALKDLVIDAVWWGMGPENPQSVWYPSIGKRFTAAASGIFTHSVTYRPENADFFCLENWTCAPNAHNLAAGGKQEAAHLLILEPGEATSGSISYTIESIP